MAQKRLSGLFAERYLIERELGHGASAVVYLANDKKHDREIALKVLSKDLAHALGPQRFLREIHVTSRLHHPHILAIYDSGEWNGLLYYVLPFVRGESLRERIDREKQLPIEECVRITCEVADALAHAHAAGVIHRDVKPENIMISDGHALLSDFGIARALDVHTAERLTSSGLIVGTSAYMSPEQASGEENIDTRSDVYSLACVLYEMIAGVQPFIGPTTQAVIAQRFTHTPRPVSTYRPAVPEHMETVLEKALAIAPADRFQTVKDFSAELSGAPSASRERRRSPLWRALYGRPKAFGFAAVALAVITGAFVIANPPGDWRSIFGGSAALDSTKFAVIPILHNSAPTQSELTVAGGLYHALGGWKGLSLADPAAMSPRTAASLPEALGLAKRYGAGKLVIAETLPRAGQSFIAALYDVRLSSKISDISSEDLKGAESPYSAAVLGLLRLPDLPKRAEGGEGKTSSLPALLAYGRGHIALSHWDLPTAKREFQAAVAADPDFAPARLWSAMLNEWTTPSDTTSWRDDAVRASLASDGLSAHDATLAAALAALARRDYPTACVQYRALALADSVDFVAPFGLGDCQSMDDKVLPAPSSSSGWRFRSSYRGALEAYTRAFKLEPGAYALVSYTKLQQLLPIRSTSFRLGHQPQSNSAPFPAFPSIDHDTLAFVPYSMSAFAALPAAATTTHVRAIERNLETLLGFITEWTRSDPRSADAEEALADVLETRGNVGSHGAGPRSASDAVSQALRLSSDPIQRIRLTATEVRLRIKRGEFSSARSLADSLVAAASQSDPRSIRDLLAIAAATGRIALAGRLLASMTVNPLIPTQVGQASVPAQVRDVASSLLAHAALGDCGSATKDLMSQLDNRLETYVSENDRASIRAAVIARPASMLGPCTGARSALEVRAPIDRLLRLQQAFARNDRGAVRAMFDTLAKLRRSERPGDLSLDYTYQEAWLRLALGDTLAGLQQLDHSLEALATLASVHDFAAAAALGRAMVLRADLANARGDRATARRYARAVTELWASADAELQPSVARMRALASMQAGGR